MFIWPLGDSEVHSGNWKLVSFMLAIGGIVMFMLAITLSPNDQLEQHYDTMATMNLTIPQWPT
jgi:hypothetical protein